MNHESVFKVQATQVDMFGHLNNAKYLEMFEWARWALHEQQGGVDVYEHTVHSSVGPAVVHVDVDFLSEVKVGEEVRIQSRIEKIGDRSVTLAQDMLKSDGTIAARAKFIWAFMNFKTRKGAPMPDDLRRMYMEWAKD